ncbi:MAG TPA: ABC transporter substrate-binding protein [Gaiellales bacterium]|nr:ABC transporter substrate-binding protein [Gaiellales bacterium]
MTVLAIVMLIAACGQPASGASNALVLGAIYPLSGQQASGGQDELAGVQTALQLAQPSRPVQLKVVDATTPDAAAAAVDRLVSHDHVPAILGTYGSTLSAAASARAEQLKTIYWETGAVADPITAQRSYVFRTVATGSSLGRMAVTFTHDVLLPASGLKSPRVAIVEVDDIYGHSVGGGEAALAKQLGIDVVDIIDYNPYAFDPDALARRIAADSAQFLWDVSYLDDGVAIWQAIIRDRVPLLAAVGTSSAFCMPAFGDRLGRDAIGVYAADKPDGDISRAALSAAGAALLARAQAAYARNHDGASMSIPAVAGFVGAWTLLHDVLAKMSGAITPAAIRAAALAVDVPVGDEINGGGVKFGPAGSLDEGQNTRAAAVVGQWQGVGNMQIVYPAAFATAKPLPLAAT